MGTTHVVAQGEHLTGIADKYGFRDFLTLWNHPDHAALKKLRVDPHVLLPGDAIVIPDKTIRKDARPGRTLRLPRPLGPDADDRQPGRREP